MRLFSTFCFLFVILTTFAQKASVEKSTFGIQTGIAGFWFNNESRISTTIALRGEIGYEFSGNSGLYVYSPVFTLEPRYYYNLNKRANKGRKIINNTGSYFSLRTEVRPSLNAFSNYGNIDIDSDITFIPSWGIRKTHWKTFLHRKWFRLQSKEKHR